MMELAGVGTWQLMANGGVVGPNAAQGAAVHSGASTSLPTETGAGLNLCPFSPSAPSGWHLRKENGESTAGNEC